MKIDFETPNSPGWWFHRLLKKLESERPRYEKLNRYYRGEQGIPVNADKTVKEAYQRMMALSVTNTPQLIVRAPLTRMRLIGCRTAAEGDELGDKVGAQILAGNGLDADSGLVHRSSLALSMGYVIVGGIDEETGVPLVTPEDPTEVTVVTDPARRRKVLAALKVYRDDIYGVDKAVMFLPGEVYRAERVASANSGASDWEWTLNPDEPEKLFPGRVPVVPFPCNPDVAGRTTGVFEAHLGLIDRINYTVLQRLEIATLQAFRQRAIKGVPITDEHGNDIDYSDIFEASPGAMWQIPDTAEIWESGQVDLGPVRQSVRDDLSDLAGMTGVPLFYVTPDASDGSAEGATLAREQLVFMVGDLIREASESWKRVLSHAFFAMGDHVRARLGEIEILWAPPERRSLSEMGDGAAKALAGGMSIRETLRDVWGKTPLEIERIEADRQAEALVALGVEAAAEWANR